MFFWWMWDCGIFCIWVVVIDYGQRYRIEFDVSCMLSDVVGVVLYEVIVLDFIQIGSSFLMSSEMDVLDVDEDDQVCIVVFYCNVFFVIVVVVYVEMQGIIDIFILLVKDDYMVY